MLHYAAKQRLDTGRWDYVCGNAPTGYCGKAGGSHHATEAEARECYKQYVLDTQLRFTKQNNQMNRCRVCKTFTDGLATVGLYRMFVVCEEHQTRDAISDLLGTIGDSWES